MLPNFLCTVTKIFFYIKMIIVIKQNTKSHNVILNVSTQNHGLEGMPSFF